MMSRKTIVTGYEWNARRREERIEGMRHFGYGIRPAQQLKVCPKCGAACAAALHYCPACGGKLPSVNLYEAVTRDKPHCPHCGVVIAARSKFCPHCGKALAQTQAQIGRPTG